MVSNIRMFYYKKNNRVFTNWLSSILVLFSLDLFVVLLFDFIIFSILNSALSLGN